MEKPLTSVAKVVGRLSAGRRVYVVGDVHGHLDKLVSIHEQIRADLHRRPVAAPLLVHLGDLIDRGPDSAGCVALLAGGPPIRGVPTINLRGNHERMLMDALCEVRGEAADRWLDNGGAEALSSWGLKCGDGPRAWMAGIPARHLVFLRDLRQRHLEEGYLFAHAGVRPGVPLNRQAEMDLLWIREPFLKWDGVMLPDTPSCIVVHGHTPTKHPVIRSNRIGLDTGAGKGGALSCGILDATEIRVIQAG